MGTRERLTATPPGVVLGPLDLIDDHGARGFVLQIGVDYFHGFVVRRGLAVRGYVDRCPHMGVPLARELDSYLSPLSDHIVCGWHGALFREADGVCVRGPCAGASLIAWTVQVKDDLIVTA